MAVNTGDAVEVAPVGEPSHTVRAFLAAAAMQVPGLAVVDEYQPTRGSPNVADFAQRRLKVRSGAEAMVATTVPARASAAAPARRLAASGNQASG